MKKSKKARRVPRFGSYGASWDPLGPAPLERWQHGPMVLWQPSAEEEEAEEEQAEEESEALQFSVPTSCEGEGEGEGGSDGEGEGEADEENAADGESSGVDRESADKDKEAAEAAGEPLDIDIEIIVEEKPSGQEDQEDHESAEAQEAEEADENEEEASNVEDDPSKLAWNLPEVEAPKLDPTLAALGAHPLWARLAEEVSGALVAGGSPRGAPHPDAPELAERAATLSHHPGWGVLRDLARGQPTYVKGVAPAFVDWMLGSGSEAELDELLGGAVEALARLKADIGSIAPGLEDADPDGAVDDRIELADRLLSNPIIRKVIELAGRIASQAYSTRRVVSTLVREEISDVSRGDDLTLALIEQIAFLGHADLRALFFQDYAESALLQYVMTGAETARRGPIVLLLDESGSMSRDPSVDKAGDLCANDLASAIAIGALRMAHAQKRDVYLAGFDGRVRWSREVPYRAGPQKVAEFVKWAVGRNADGGSTEFGPPLVWALDLVEKKKINADVIFLTDGHGSMPHSVATRLRDAKRRRGLGLFLLTIRAAATDPLKSIADAIVEVSTDAGCLDFGTKFVTTERA